MKKSDLSTVVKSFAGEFPTHVLSDVEFVSPAILSPNPFNSIFEQEEDSHLGELRKDIEERGILTPLQAIVVTKKMGEVTNGRLLSGHNRWRIARDLGLEHVPVQWIKSDLDEEREKEFVVKDNLLRRHLSKEQRIAVYRFLYPNFDTVALGTAKGKYAGKEAGMSKRRLARHLAEKTGRSERSVLQDIVEANPVIRRSKNMDSLINEDFPITINSKKDISAKVRLALQKANPKQLREILRITEELLQK